MSLFRQSAIAIVCLGLMSATYAAKTVEIELFDGKGKTTPIGTVTLTDTAYGLVIQPNLKNLPAGLHGFHIHDHASCDHNGMDASGHLDPANTGKHMGPYDNSGHLGDLPALIVAANGTATLEVLAPKLKLSDLDNHAMMIHAGGDNYSDQPEKLGGGGARIACGVIK